MLLLDSEKKIGMYFQKEFSLYIEESLAGK